MSTESRLDKLGMRGLSGEQLIQALLRRREELETDQTISRSNKILQQAAIELELKKQGGEQ